MIPGRSRAAHAFMTCRDAKSRNRYESMLMTRLRLAGSSTNHPLRDGNNDVAVNSPMAGGIPAMPVAGRDLFWLFPWGLRASTAAEAERYPAFTQDSCWLLQQKAVNYHRRSLACCDQIRGANSRREKDTTAVRQ
jgi:hypothetical protein